MKYTSTRNSSISITAADAIAKGISEDGGLFVPQDFASLPKLTPDVIKELANKPYHEIAFDILKPFLGFLDEDLRKCVNDAYGLNFHALGITRLVKLDDAVNMLELWHGPTAAFKDMALQILPGLLKVSMRKIGRTGKTLILVATSGDTGKAALEGFKNIPDVEIAVFYPEEGVSETQKLQMVTQEGENVHVFAVKGNFDDCQNAVKAAFANPSVVSRATIAGVGFSSANSINWGRLCPQIVYYVYAYAELVRKNTIQCGDKVNICVPTGNFGNILAAYYAMEMGLPVNKLICASNTNNILTDFIETGVFDRNREFHTTASPSMDILISSNLERLLFHLAEGNDTLIKGWFASLAETGKFEVDSKTKSKIKSIFQAGWCNEQDTSLSITRVYNDYGYLMDTHTAVAYKVCRDYIGNVNKSRIKTIVASTASPYKFGESVYEALFGTYIQEEFVAEFFDDADTSEVADETIETAPEVAAEVPEATEAAAEIAETTEETTETPDICETAEYTLMRALENRTGIRIPKPLTEINGKQIRFTETLEKAQIKDAVIKILSK
jgi:threonine synthase